VTTTGASPYFVSYISLASKEFLKRRDEAFLRICPKSLADLFAEYEDTGKGEPAQEMVARMVKNDDGEYVMERQPAEDNQSHNGPRVVSYDAEETEQYDAPYLILDTRPREDFAKNRIHRGMYIFISRSTILI
jgi:centrosomal protein CEP41